VPGVAAPIDKELGGATTGPEQLVRSASSVDPIGHVEELVPSVAARVSATDASACIPIDVESQAARKRSVTRFMVPDEEHSKSERVRTDGTTARYEWR